MAYIFLIRVVNYWIACLIIVIMLHYHFNKVLWIKGGRYDYIKYPYLLTSNGYNILDGQNILHNNLHSIMACREMSYHYNGFIN